MKKFFLIYLFTPFLYGIGTDPYVRPIIEGTIKVIDGKILFPHGETVDFDQLHTKLENNPDISYLVDFFNGKDLALVRKISQNKCTQTDEEKDLSSHMQSLYPKIIQIAGKESMNPEVLFERHLRALKNQREEYFTALCQYDEKKLSEVLKSPLHLGDFN